MSKSGQAVSLSEIESAEYVVIVDGRVVFASSSLIAVVEYRISRGGMIASILRDIRT